MAVNFKLAFGKKTKQFNKSETIQTKINNKENQNNRGNENKKQYSTFLPKINFEVRGQTNRTHASRWVSSRAAPITAREKKGRRFKTKTG